MVFDRKRLSLAVVLAAAAAASSPAQVLVHESLTGPDWTHAHAAPWWAGTVANTDSDFGVVEQLNQVWWLQFTRAPMTLQPGTYRCSTFFRKDGSTIGRYPLTLRAELPGGVNVDAVTPDAAQAVDTWDTSTALEFVVRDADTDVTFRFQNTAGVLKSGYSFDSFILSKVDGPDVELVSPVTCPSPPSIDEASGASPFGTICRLDSVIGTSGIPLGGAVLGKGDYTATLRMRDDNAPPGAVPPELYATWGSFQRWSTSAPQSGPGPWMTLRLRFLVDQTDFVNFTVDPTFSSLPLVDYDFASFSVTRNGALGTFGQGCAGSNGVPELSPGEPPYVGQPFSVEGSNLRPNGIGYYMHSASRYRFGTFELPLDLGFLGATGCFQLVDPNVVVPATSDGAGNTTVGFTVPNDPTLSGASFYNQFVWLDPGVNALGLVYSNGGQGVVR